MRFPAPKLRRDRVLKHSVDFQFALQAAQIDQHVLHRLIALVAIFGQRPGDDAFKFRRHFACMNLPTAQALLQNQRDRF